MHELRKRGGHVIAQDKESSVIYGMNREVVQNGDAHEVIPVEGIAARIHERLRGRVAARRVG
jgi:two-component system chemotaxis response regulator CheB